MSTPAPTPHQAAPVDRLERVLDGSDIGSRRTGVEKLPDDLGEVYRFAEAVIRRSGSS